MSEVTRSFETGTLKETNHLGASGMEKDSKIERKDKAVGKENKMRARSKSLFQADRPKLKDLDRGEFVVTHADIPRRLRSRSLPLDSEKLQPKLIVFDRAKVTKIITDVFESKLASMSYSAKGCEPLAKELASIIKEKVVDLNFPGYKLACTCIITKRLKPAPVLESGCVWDEQKASIEEDSFAEYAYRNNDLYALGTVYGAYCKTFGEKKTNPKTPSSRGRMIPTPIPE